MNYKIPQNLDLPALLDSTLNHKWNTPKRIEKLYFIISFINTITISSRPDYSKYIGLSSQYIAKMVGSKYGPSATQLLIDLKVIEKKSDSYATGIKGTTVKPFCKQYRFTKEYWDQPLAMIEMKDKVLEKNFSASKSRVDVQSEFENWLYENVQSVTVDIKKANQLIDSFKGSAIQVAKYKQSLEQFENNDLYFTRSRPNGRVYHSIVNLPSLLKETLEYKNTKLVEIDVKSLFPYLIINKMYIKNHNVLNSCEEALIESVSKGQMYEVFVEKYNESNKKKINRDQCKQLFQKNFVSGKLNRKYISKFATMISEYFPCLFDYVKTQQKENHLKYAAILQEEEASFIIDRVGKHIFKHRPNTLFITRHDSIISDLRNEKYIVDLLNRAFEDQPLKPIFDIKTIN